MTPILRNSIPPLTGRLAEQRYSHKTMHELFNQISGTKCDTAVVGVEQQHFSAQSLVCVQEGLLSPWMTQCYGHTSTTWMDKKKLAVHFALLGLSEHASFCPPCVRMGCSWTSPLAKSFSPTTNDLTKKGCKIFASKMPFIELGAQRLVPFRLTPNIFHFLDIFIDGHFVGVLPAVARLLNAQSVVWLRPILWDVFAKVAEDDPQLILSSVNLDKNAHLLVEISENAFSTCTDISQELNKINSTVLVYPIGEQKLVQCLLKRTAGDVMSFAKELKMQAGLPLTSVRMFSSGNQDFIRAEVSEKYCALLEKLDATSEKWNEKWSQFQDKWSQFQYFLVALLSAFGLATFSVLSDVKGIENALKAMQESMKELESDVKYLKTK